LGPRPPESKQPRRRLGLPSTRLDSEKLIIFDAEEDLAASLAKYTAELSAKFAAERGAFTVVLSGGSLVKALRFWTGLRPPSCWFPDCVGCLRS